MTGFGAAWFGEPRGAVSDQASDKHDRPAPRPLQKVTVMAMKTPYRLFTASHGVTFAVRFLPVGARYGRRNVLTVDKHPMVEFWDTRWADDGDEMIDTAHHGFGPMGQFVSRYYLSTVLAHEAGAGINLDGSVPDWRIDGSAMASVRRWLITHTG